MDDNFANQDEFAETQTEAATQRLTQEQFDPRRRGRNNSGLNESDASDVFCILHPASPAAFNIVAHTARTKPQHVLNQGMRTFRRSTRHPPNQADATSVNSANRPQELALRFSSEVVNPVLGFCFGRHPTACDIVLVSNDINKRVSNKHFRIFINQDGIMMLEDTSSNGTIVDNITIGGSKRNNGQNPKAHMLASGACIAILSDSDDEMIKFILVIPGRPGSEVEYITNFQRYMEYQAVAVQRQKLGIPMPAGGPRAMMATSGIRSANPRSTLNPPGVTSNYGMKWNGGDKYTCVGVVGKGAFATVYQIATRLDGTLFAAKELEKKRFMKNGMWDERLSNELQIMNKLRHNHIVDYRDAVETETHLYIIMEYVRCGDLQAYMAPDEDGRVRRTLSEDLGRMVAQQILSALAYLHDMDVTHRDIKPDNILISSEDPFVVKLTDFGLSKMVKDTDTFLKTFCGTLLYCAPEVFPFFESEGPPRPTKRRRDGQRRSYSQLVDIWSFAAVLWYTLCGQPPFQGITDGNGRAMFNRIMSTTLNTKPLIDMGISDVCIDLLVDMLSTDPAMRPTESDCLEHAWFANHSQLTTIPEVDEDLDCSNLSIQDRSGHPGKLTTSTVSDTDDVTTPPLNKRHKGESFFGTEERTQMLPSWEASSLYGPPAVDEHQRLMLIPHNETIVQHAQQAQPGARLPSVLRSSGIFGPQMSSAPGEPLIGEPDVDSSAERRDGVVTGELGSEEHGRIDALADANISQTDWLQIEADTAAARLEPSEVDSRQDEGLESMVRDLTMISPESSVSASALENVLLTPKAAQAQFQQPIVREEGVQHRPSDAELTPKQPIFRRQINLPLSPSFFYDPFDPSTHNVEYASRVSGLNFLGNLALSSTDAPPEITPKSAPTSVASTTDISVTSSAEAYHSPNKENEYGDYDFSPPMSIPSFPTATGAFLKPPAVLGKLTSTTSSFIPLTLNLTQRVTTWGRHPNNTIVYRNGLDTRVPKVALEVYFHAPGIEDIDKAGQDWTNMEDLHVGLATQSRAIWVNGVLLPDKDDQGRKCYGRLYTGDVICVGKAGEGKGLLFACEFFVGKSAKKRRESKGTFVVEVD